MFWWNSAPISWESFYIQRNKIYNMLESLFNFEELKQKPYLMFFWSLIIGAAGVWITTWIRYEMVVSDIIIDLSGVFSVLFIVIPSVYFITLLIKKEEEMEEEEIRRHYTKDFWGRHGKDILILLLYFAGLTVVFSLSSFFLPTDFFQVQHEKICEIRNCEYPFQGQVTGHVTGFENVLFNNLQVMFFAFIFSFIFGAGAVFILAWNASILGVYIGSHLSKFVWHIPYYSLPFVPHGTLEIAGYICAALAGGIISAAVLRKNTGEVLRIIALDSLKLLIFGAVLIFAGAAVEVYF
jgi:uncharacterized membrane protein SpoIIM required for sporulation